MHGRVQLQYSKKRVRGEGLKFVERLGSQGMDNEGVKNDRRGHEPGPERRCHFGVIYANGIFRRNDCKKMETVGEEEMVDLPLSELSGESSGETKLRFESPEDEGKFKYILQHLQTCIVVYLMTSAVSICSSNYTAHPSHLDSVLLLMDIMTIDICSCFFVMGGFLATYVFSSVGKEVYGELRLRIMSQQFGNMWLSTLLVVFFGGIDKVLKDRFHWGDVWLTMVEGVTGLRVFDSKQALDQPHTFNVALWPVQSMVWCLLSVDATYTTNEVLRKKFGEGANYVILCMSLCGIILFTLFGMLHSHTNVFYANATSVMYRMLEFNLGIHFFYLTERNYPLVVSLTRIMNQCSFAVYFVFAATWWSEVGIKAGQGDICLRLYPRNNCLMDHHAFLLRGCFVGLTVLSAVRQDAACALTVQEMITRTSICATAAAFCWPAYLMIQLIFVITFSDTLVFENGALVSLMMPCFLLLASFLYTLGLQSHMTDQVEGAFRHAWQKANLWYLSVCGSVLTSREEEVTRV